MQRKCMRSVLCHTACTGCARAQGDRTRRPRRSSSLCTETELAQDDRPPCRPGRRHSSPTASALSVWYGCASGVAYTRVLAAVTSWLMFLAAA